MSNLLVIKTEKLADYLYWLLPAFFKKKEKQNSNVYKLLTVFGEQFEEIRDTIYEVNNQFYIETASLKYLDEIGKARGVFRLSLESDDEYRVRIKDAHVEKQKAGTNIGMIDGLKTIGFETQVIELYKTDRLRWSEFIIRIISWDHINSQTLFFNEINRLKPAHTRMIIDPLIELDELDGGYFDDIENPFDSFEL